MIRLQKILTSVLLSPFTDDFDETCCHFGEIHVAKNWRHPLASRHLVTEALSPTTLKELNPVSKHTDELGSGPFLS